ncbi:hypothetical protein NP493_53g04009 [Ridgeia piscesae]|uniref:EF-hand domain-containing protein n=1 Tax=Ridgeia piscesae TaxID=27915 RepID=A0AAD9UJB8_RIDPI|nr:hypothetical protein NP493_53g04009 [Ridgeia piscesae]
MEKVDAAANELRQNQVLYDHFLQRMDVWLQRNSHKVLTVMKRFDRDQESYVTYDEFKSAMFDIDAPCNAVELHLLCKVLDISGDKDIDYTMLHEGLYNITSPEEGLVSDIRPDNKSLVSTLSVHPTEPEVTSLVQWLGSKKTYTPDTPRYAQVHLRNVTFAKDKSHSSHVSEVVEVSTNGLSLAEIIREKTQTSVTSRELKLFISRQCTAEHLFAPDSTLWEHGCLGGPRSHPEPVLLYYNYHTLFKDCPILMCDYYINIIPTTNRDKLKTKRAQRPIIDRQQSKSNTSKTASERRDS